MAWCRQATSHYLNHCWHRPIMPYGFTRPQWVNKRSGSLTLIGTQDTSWNGAYHLVAIAGFITLVPYPPYRVTVPSWKNWVDVNSSPPSAACMRQWTGSALVQIMAYCLFDAKPLPEPMLNYCQLDTYEQISVKFNSNYKIVIHENALENVVCEMAIILSRKRWVKRVAVTLRPRQNGRHFADDTFKYIFLNENVWIPIKISLKFVPKGPINNIPALVQIMAWRRPGDKPLSEPMVVSLPTHICVARPQWVKW